MEPHFHCIIPRFDSLQPSWHHRGREGSSIAHGQDVKTFQQLAKSVSCPFYSSSWAYLLNWAMGFRSKAAGEPSGYTIRDIHPCLSLVSVFPNRIFRFQSRADPENSDHQYGTNAIFKESVSDGIDSRCTPVTHELLDAHSLCLVVPVTRSITSSRLSGSNRLGRW